MSRDVIACLRAVQEFVELELENRGQSGLPEYISDAQKALDSVSQAIETLSTPARPHPDTERLDDIAAYLMDRCRYNGFAQLRLNAHGNGLFTVELGKCGLSFREGLDIWREADRRLIEAGREYLAKKERDRQ